MTSNGAFQPQMKIAQGPRHGGFERSAWGADEPHTLSRTIFFYFNPSQLGIGPDLGGLALVVATAVILRGRLIDRYGIEARGVGRERRLRSAALLGSSRRRDDT